MKKITAIAAVAASLVMSLQIGTASAETLRVGMECTYAPFNYRTAAGDLDGYDVDVAKGVGEIIGADIEYVCQKWDGMIPALLANKFDLVIASMSITNKRIEKMDFSAPYRVSVGRLVGAKSKHYKLFDDAGMPMASSFDGVRVGLERASTYADWFAAKMPDAEVVFYDSSESLYLDLTNGRIDVLMTNPMKAHLKFLSKDKGAKYEFVSPAINEEEYFGIGVGIGLRKGNDALKSRLDDAVIQLSKDGSLKKYALKYFPFAIHNEEWTN